VTDTSSSRLDPALVDRLIGELVKVPADAWRQMFADLLAYDDLAEIDHITTPTLLIWGDADALVDREMQNTLAARLTNAELTIYPGVGHTPRWEQPARFASDLARFTHRTIQTPT
jgi:pimeloyl-ACP methyl ester carboxylesterase